MINDSSLSPGRKLRRNFLQRALNQGVAWDGILRLRWRLAQERHACADGMARLVHFEEKHAGKPREVREFWAGFESFRSVSNDNAGSLGHNGGPPL